MADVLNRSTLELRLSVNTPDFPIESWVINPVLPACEPRYWKLSGDVVSEMNQAEKDAVDAALVPPAMLYPYEFQRLLTSQQKAIIWNSTEPPLTDLAVDLLTIVSPMPFTAGSDLANAVLILGQAIPQVFTESEVTRILAMKAPQ